MSTTIQPWKQCAGWAAGSRPRPSGRLRIRVYLAGQLGREGGHGRSDALRRAGHYTRQFRFTEQCISADTGAGAALASRFGRPTCVASSMARLGTLVLKGFEQRDLVGLAIYDAGSRSFYNVRACRPRAGRSCTDSRFVYRRRISFSTGASTRRQSDAAAIRRGLLRHADAPDRWRGEQLAYVSYQPAVRSGALLVAFRAFVFARGAADVATDVRCAVR